ncbi:TonB-dependent receptor [Sphingomonadaceae bacterium jetA1]|jgi:outer membrane receptor protein involved in Fe transport|uniref:TonB-dependent receptor domain-containing protein n=1 Tax=Facivitalis istanbulensis TaxID=3075838 RepID=UPI00347F70C4
MVRAIDRSIGGWAIVVAVLLPMPAAARSRDQDAPRAFDIRPGPLAQALVTLGMQAGISVATSDPMLARTALRHRIVGRMTVAAALDRLLAGTGMRAVRVMDGLYRIERAPPPHPRRAPTQPSPPSPVIGREIVVTASKRDLPLNDYPGSAHILMGDTLRPAHGGAPDTQALVQALPILASTSLGPGREKLFIRGIADSSFTGGSQATVGQYLGDVQINYSTPDPNLALYDVERVELLEGPQGSLYGTGALGGVIRITPAPPRFDRWSGTVGADAVHLAHGGMGGNLFGVVNAPLARDAALRVVGYGSVMPGYIFDTRRGRRGVNRGEVVGGRAALRLRPGGDWTIDVGATYQRTANHDAQYADGGTTRPSRATPGTQPSSHDFRLASVTVHREWAGGQALTAAFSLVENRLSAHYDATPSGGAVRTVESREAARVMTGELRLSRRRPGGTGFVLGAYATLSDDRLTQTARTRGTEQPLRGVGNRIVDIALFGEGTVRLAPRLTGTIGLRANYLDFSGITILPDGQEQDAAIAVPGQGDVIFIPSAALAWTATPSLTPYLRYQRGYRVGGYALNARRAADPDDDPDGDDALADYEAFHPDTLDVIEMGMRFGGRRDRLSGSVALSRAKWRHIQSDLLGLNGPYTVNIGDGRIHGLEATLDWRPDAATEGELSLFLAHSTLTAPAPDFARLRLQSLPNTPALGLRIAGQRQWRIGQDDALSLHAALRYAGRSWLGVGPLHIAQRGYLQADGGLAWTRQQVSWTLDVTNLFDMRGNRFSSGNPLASRTNGQWTPLPPRTIRLGLRYGF